ncbi:potassium/sodium hyperpolarization-activated cyclic nucleotide-gated channel 4-like [Globicephala melas]|uniref:potassium/sodium hyperpolarization-activated cyclic nucleotide-gated channel 4-like n=1 Tax=Globicephala melas TaxID=9731 RepID=UPI00387303F4
MTIPGIVCHLQISHSESHAAILAPDTAAGSPCTGGGLSKPGQLFLLPSGIQTPWQLLGSSTETGMFAFTPNRPKFLPRRPAKLLQVCSAAPARALTGAAAGAASLAPRTRRSARWLSPIPHFPPLNPGAPSSSPPPPPQPPAAWSCCTFPSSGAPQPPRCTPNPFTARPPLGVKKRKPDEPKRGAAGVGARRKGEGEGTYFSRRGAERCRREIKARIRAAWKPADAVVSALQSRRRWRWRPQGTGTGARAAGAARLGSAGARAALQLGPRLRAAPLLAPLWLLAPTPGSHMTPAPLALRASQGWRGENTLRTEAVLCVTVFPVPGYRRPPLSRRVKCPHPLSGILRERLWLL